MVRIIPNSSSTLPCSGCSWEADGVGRCQLDRYADLLSKPLRPQVSPNTSMRKIAHDTAACKDKAWPLAQPGFSITRTPPALPTLNPRPRRSRPRRRDQLPPRPREPTARGVGPGTEPAVCARNLRNMSPASCQHHRSNGSPGSNRSEGSSWANSTVVARKLVLRGNGLTSLACCDHAHQSIERGGRMPLDEFLGNCRAAVFEWGRGTRPFKFHLRRRLLGWNPLTWCRRGDSNLLWWVATQAT